MQIRFIVIGRFIVCEQHRSMVTLHIKYLRKNIKGNAIN